MKSISELAAQITDPTDRLRLEVFGRDYATPEHAWLARCAAFPVALTTDVLYKIWLNFRQTDSGETLDIPINAVADLLLSPLCREIGYDLYEMYPEVRAVLWQSLSAETVASLAEFMLRYLDFCRDKIPSDAFAEAQRIWAESFQHPEKVAQLLHQLLSERKTKPGSRLMADYVLSWVKHRNQWSTQITSGTANARDALSDLAQLAEGIQQYEKGQRSKANATFSSLTHLLQAPRNSGFNVPIPREIWENLPVNAPVEPQKGKIYAVLVGIEEYGEKLENKRFLGCINDVVSWKKLLKERFRCESTVSLTNSDATKEAIINALQDIFSKLQAEDTLFFTFSGHADNKELPHLLATYDTDTAQKESYFSEIEFRSLISQPNSRNPFVTVILDTHAGSSGWIDTNNEKHILLAATASGEMSIEVDKKGLFTSTLQSILDEKNSPLITYQKLIRECFRKIKKARFKQTPQLFGHYNAFTLTFLAGSMYYDTYWHELLAICGYSNHENTSAKVNIQDIADEFGPEMTAGNINTTLEKYSLLKNQKRLKIVRISSGINLRQIPIFQREYIRTLPYEVEIKDVSLFYRPDQNGMKDAVAPLEELEDDLSALQDAQVIVFILNRALVSDFARHSFIAPIINHLRRFEYKVVCSILWEDCDWQRTVLKDSPVFSKKEPLVRSLTGFETELEIKRHYEHDWQPVINKWIKDLAALGFEEELQARLEKAHESGYLDLGGMGFEQLPEQIWELENLTTIDLYNNKLKELPESLMQFRSLEKLYASKNPLTSLPLFLSDLPNLRVLKIDNAQITEFPNGLCKHPALEDISMENNQIEIIPSALKDMPKLKLFDFRGNPVINLSQSVLKATKERLKHHFELIYTSHYKSTSYQSDSILFFLENSNEVFNYNEESLFGKTLDICSTSISNYEGIFHFIHSITTRAYKNLLIHLPWGNLADENTQKLSKLFIEYPTGTIFFLNFSNSKHLAELLYQQKQAPIIAFEGELDEEMAGNAVRYFYAEFQESKNAISAFQYMILKLPETPYKGLYTLYRY